MHILGVDISEIGTNIEDMWEEIFTDKFYFTCKLKQSLPFSFFVPRQKSKKKRHHSVSH